ncbi:molybdenum biosynthesis protein MoaD [Sulfodiicoccus acidiphilus]|uniref:Molybdenum biosynthesis protein MoaD n=1 Tax=Sulfodiicoccus acidiphilus TaxID=1670455 RepID=A0A348B4F1_9CREN|nr:MoaD family protein [Sulfodiicoccus acidiphilus]BBD73053.1 molybdenum biosynthesis protein MoaD [Sulfodiicoccus acidiphilus]GGU03918.1 molybdenum biosynthesis protein MoaD [Sulfodiicoccus acidiphilus]
MKVKVLYFAFLRDLAGVEEETVEVDCHNLDCLVSELERRHGKALGNALREGYAGVKVVPLVNSRPGVRELKEGDEVAFIPPPSGGDLRKEGLDFLELLAKFRRDAPPDAGSIVTYLGFVKGRVEGHRVDSLEYQVYESYTLARFREIEDELKSKYPDLVKLEIHHVVGKRSPGEDVMLIMAMGRGRGDALKAVAEAVELVKHTTGIWKLETRDDGQYWVVAGNTRVRKQ